jgi:hypothetical protein
MSPIFVPSSKHDRGGIPGEPCPDRVGLAFDPGRLGLPDFIQGAKSTACLAQRKSPGADKNPTGFRRLRASSS